MRAQHANPYICVPRDQRSYRSVVNIELTVNNIAALYFKDYFDLGLKGAGIVAGLFGLMNIFARTLAAHSATAPAGSGA